MGKRGSRSRKRPSHYERRARKLPQDGGHHRKRAKLISNSVIVAAVFTTANNLAQAYGVLPYDYYYYVIVQWAMIGSFGFLLYFIYVWNSRVPVYREVFWMVVIYTMAASWLLSAAPW